MKTTTGILFFFFCFSFSIYGQGIDTSGVVREVDSLIYLNNTLYDQSQIDSALVVIQQAETKIVSYLGNKHSKYAECLFYHARTLNKNNELSNSLLLYLQCEEIRKVTLGKWNLDYAKTIYNIGKIYMAMGYYDKCEAYYLEVKEIREVILGKQHLDYIGVMTNIGNLYADLGQYQKSELFYIETQDIVKNVLGKDHQKYIDVTQNLGLLYIEMGMYEKAESALLESKYLQKKTLEEQPVSYIGILNNLGMLYGAVEDYRKSEECFLEALVTYEQLTSVQDDILYASLKHNLGLIYFYLNNLSTAEKYLLNAKEIRFKVVGDTHPEYGTVLLNLANVYLRMNKYDDAEVLLLKSKNIQTSSIGKDHPNYINIIYSLGVLYHEIGQLEKSVQMLSESVDIAERILGVTDAKYPRNLTALANVYILQRKYFTADSLLTHAIILYNNITKGYRDGFFAALEIQFGLNKTQGKLENCTKLMMQLLHFSKILFKESALYLSENEQCLYANRFKETITNSYSLIWDEKLHYEDVTKTGFDFALLSKEYILTNKAHIKSMMAQDMQSNLMFEQMLVSSKLLVAEYSKPINERTNVEELEEEANALEKELVRTVSGFGDAIRQVSWSEVQAALQPGEAALEFIHFNYYKTQLTDSVLYAVMLLKPGMERPLFVPLFEEKSLRALLPKNGRLNADQINALYGTDNALYSLLWSPLEPYLKEVRRVYHAPSGLLHRLNMAALPTGQGNLLSDRHDLVLLGSTRQLVVGASSGERNSHNALAYGGIQFDMDSTAYKAPTTDGIDLRRGAAFDFSDTTARGDNWQYLKWSEKEVENLRPVFERAGIAVQVHKAWQATEESFKQIGKKEPSPRILHLSTHGFFFPDPKARKEGSRIGGENVAFKMSEHPMIRSGLLLAGANHAWKTGRPLGSREDGILTAYEISHLDLRGTDLVVLSACETGLGHIEGNEGVYGLQRAFKIAGAKKLILSLWQVPDYQTQELMAIFYQKWLTEKLSVRAALHAAQDTLRRKGYEPYYWAGFVLVE